MIRRPYGAYAFLSASWWALLAGNVLLARQLGRHLPSRVGTTEVLALGLATYRLSRLVAFDRVTSLLRSPFVRTVKGPGRPEGAREAPRGTGLRRALGELFT